jgi:hypothetical protein
MAELDCKRIAAAIACVILPPITLRSEAGAQGPVAVDLGSSASRRFHGHQIQSLSYAGAARLTRKVDRDLKRVKAFILEPWLNTALAWADR